MFESKLTFFEAAAANRWRTVLSNAVAELGTKQRVAERLGVSRPYVSRVISGDIDPVPQTFIDRVINRLDVVTCPHTFRSQVRHDCRHSLGPAPTHNPYRLALWQCCQKCPNKPQQEA